ncbi:hypothetical protein L915_01921 [Phytophthora nicotianae]|uniref:Uncharacterized protein n=1 Tax=Phytophthora nicotianae TaxID=4792 RepID=W2HIL3_PHYNI|nr:hypothetical protein L915_01921 [Phytophthora nicotianae]ETL42376.1 hypothetical protein L916_06813 [Phytophthora nicotianae]
MRQGPSVCHRSVHGPVHAAASPGRRRWRAYSATSKRQENNDHRECFHLYGWLASHLVLKRTVSRPHRAVCKDGS